MGRTPRCSKDGLNRGSWAAAEDKLLIDYVALHGEGKWSNVAKKTGLKRCGKSCRLRWLNYLRPDIKRGNISDDEEQLIIRLHKLLGNRWSLIAGRLPGRTDNEIKNYWNTNLAKKEQEFQLTLPKLIHKKQASPPTNEFPATTDTGTAVVATPPVVTQQPRKDKLINLEGDNYAQMGSILSENETESNNDHFLMDFDVEDFCKIFDSVFTGATDDHQHANDNDNVTQGDDHDVNGNGDKTEFPVNWAADNNDQIGSDFTSLVSFLDSDLEWQSGMP